jgi:hypothetical protein
VPLGSTRELSTAERHRVSRLARSGRANQAIGEYLRCALDAEEPDIELVNNPAYSDLCDAALYYVFSEFTHDYFQPREAYMNRHVDSRTRNLLPSGN